MTALEIIAAGALCFLAIFLIRYQFMTDLGFNWETAKQGEIIFGVHYDLALVMTVMALSFVLYGLCWVPLKISGLLLGWLIYIANLSNILYFKYFGQRLDWWLVKAHIGDVPSVLDSAGDLFVDKYNMLSMGSMLLMTVLVIFAGHFKPPFYQFFKKAWLNKICYGHPIFIIAGIILFLCSIMNWNYKHSYQRSGLLSSQIVKLWADQIIGYQIFASKSDSTFVHDKSMSKQSDFADPAKYMAEHFSKLDKWQEDAASDYLDGYSDWPLEPRMVSVGDTEWPLLKKINNDPEFSAKIRANLGLSPTEKPNIIFLFVESFRAYEYLHEDIGPAIFPNLRKIIGNNGVLFKQAYSSSWTSGQTARGNFSAQCSMLPNNQGMATYVGYSSLNIKCIQQYLKDNGYYTLWTSGASSSFHNMGMFERLHGIDHFVEDNYYRKHGVKSMKPGWGLKDYETLNEAVILLNKLAKTEKKPLYVNLATLSTHHPQSVLPHYEVPQNIKNQYVKDNYNYEKFLSRWRYEDAALGNFFKKLFESPIGDNTLVVLLGDHSTPVKGEDNSNFLHLQERHFRINLALITKNMQKPAVIPWPVHQIDIVPTVAHIVGADAEVSWMGRGLFARPGSAWLFAFNGEREQFRIGDRLCYRTSGRHFCFDVAGKEGLWDNIEKSHATADDDAKLDEVIEYYRAMMSAVARGKIYPPVKLKK